VPQYGLWRACRLCGQSVVTIWTEASPTESLMPPVPTMSRFAVIETHRELHVQRNLNVVGGGAARFQMHNKPSIGIQDRRYVRLLVRVRGYDQNASQA